MSAKDMREIAEMQRNRGRAYSLLKVGDRQANLKRAIACYEMALQVYTPEDFPEEWASTQYELGNAYQNLPGGDRQTNLEQAIACYEKALQVYTPDSEVWAKIQLRLGDAYRDLPDGNRQANLGQAIASYEKALQVYTSKDFPKEWAMTRFRLGEAFRNLPQGNRQINLQNAFTHYQFALQVYTRKDFSKEWAMTQHSLGDLYYSLSNEGQLTLFYPTSDAGSPPGIRDAIFCYQSTLQVYTPEDFPIEWATTQYALGNAYREISGGDRQANLERAINCFQNVLLVHTLVSAPIEWAQTQRGLGDTYRSLPAGDRQTNLEQALACYENALQVYSREDFPNEWSAIHTSLKVIKNENEQTREHLQEAEALRSAGDVQISRGERSAAIESYRQAQAIFRQLVERRKEAEVLCRIGDVQLAMGSRQRDAAMQSYGQALALFQEIGDVLGEASALGGMGDVDRAAAQESYQRASDLLQRMPGSPSISRLLATGDARREAARQSYEQALNCFLKVGNSSSAETVRTKIADTEQLREQRDRMQQRLDEHEARYPTALPVPPPMLGRVGQQLGNYRLLRLLGKGGFAEVYLGEHVYLKTQAAIKLLQTRVGNAEDLDRFLKEAQTIAHLLHRHIVRVMDFGVDAETPFLVMDYAPNGTLRQRHPKGTQVPLPLVVSYVKQIASALQYAHDERLIHRDVKPENMLVGAHDEILLSDFGIATIARSTSSQSEEKMAGTISYVAPEQIEGHPRPASDQYSLGVVVYEWLCGQCPFSGSFAEIAAKHIMTPPPPLREKMPTLPPEVEQVVMTALAKDSRQRFGSVMAFANTLERASRSVQSKRVAVPAPSQSPQQSNNSVMESTRELTLARISRRTVVLGLGIAGLAVAGGGIAWLVSSHSTSGQTPPPIPLGSVLYTYRGHSNIVEEVAWSPDGKRIASGSYDQTVQVWNAADGGYAFTYRGHSGSVNAVAWSPDGRRIASGSNDKTVQVWDAADGGHAFTYRGHSDVVLAVAWSPDGRRIASGGVDQTVQVWDAADGSHVSTYRGHADVVDTVAWSPDGRRIASGSYDQTIQVWDAADSGHVFTYRGHSGLVHTVAWSPDGKRIASGSDDKTVQVWDAVNGSHVFIYRGHSDIVLTVSWSPDDKRIASGSFDKTVQVWNAADGGHAFTYRGHSDPVDTVAWSPDGRRIASGSYDRTVQVWGAG